MKFLLGMITVMVMAASCTSSHVQTTYPGRNYRAQQSFYYYPSANVYYDGSCSRYIYQNGRSWVTGAFLPSGIYLGNDRVQVYFNGPEVWRDNDRHRNMYYRQPPVVYERRYDDRRDKHWNRERRRDDRDRGRNNRDYD